LARALWRGRSGGAGSVSRAVHGQRTSTAIAYAERRRHHQNKLAAGNKYPPTSFRVASLDGAFTDDETNDPSAMTVWGVWAPPDVGGPSIHLMDAWRKWLPLHGNPTPRLADEIAQPGDTEAVVRQREAKFRQRAGREWGLVETVRASCIRYSVDVLLIEKAASGFAVASELRRLYAQDGIAVHLVTPKGDKVARCHAIVPILAQGLVWTPNISWSDDLLLPELSNFPYGKHDDLVDSTTMALSFLRTMGYVRTEAEIKAAELDRVTHRPAQTPVRRLNEVSEDGRKRSLDAGHRDRGARLLLRYCQQSELRVAGADTGRCRGF
jgi:predicted phage terminase large subunit-like protein